MKGTLVKKGIAFLLALSMLGTMYIPANAEEDTSAQADGAEVVAQIGEETYTSLEDAIAAVPDNGKEATEIKIVIEKPLYMTPGLKIGSESSHKNIILNLQTRAMYFQPDTYSSDLTVNGMEIAYGSKVTIENGTIAMMTGKDGTKSQGSVIVNYGELNLIEGEVRGENLDASGVTVRNFNQLTTNMTIVAPGNTPFNKALVTGNYKKGVNVQTTINSGLVQSVYTEGSFRDEWGSDGKDDVSVHTYIKSGSVYRIGVCYPNGNKDLNWTFEMDKAVTGLLGGTFGYDGFCARIGTKYYASMEKAKAEAVEGDTIESLGQAGGETGGGGETGDIEEKEMSVTSTVKDNVCTATLEGNYSGTEDTDYLKVENDHLIVNLTDAEQNELESYSLTVTNQTLDSLKKSETLANVVIKTNLGTVTVAKGALDEIASQADINDKDIVLEFAKNTTINYLYYSFNTTIDGEKLYINENQPVNISVPYTTPRRGKKIQVSSSEGAGGLDYVYESEELSWSSGTSGKYQISEVDREPFEVWTKDNEKVGVYANFSKAYNACNSDQKIVMVVSGALVNGYSNGNLGDVFEEKSEGVLLEIPEGVTAVVPENEKLKIADNTIQMRVCKGAKVIKEGTILVCGESKDTGSLLVEDGAKMDTSSLSASAGYIVEHEKVEGGICYYAKSVQNAYCKMDYADGTSTYYENPQEELDFTNATKLTLLQDIEGRTLKIGATEKVADAFVLDLNGYGIVGTADTNEATITIEGHKVEIESSCMIRTSIGNMVKSISENVPALQMNAGADVNIAYNIVALSDSGPGMYMNGGIVQVEGYIASLNGLCAITGNCESTGNKVTLGRSAVVNQGDRTSVAGTAIYQNYEGELIVQGGNIGGASGIQISAGSLLVPEDSSVYIEVNYNTNVELNITGEIVNDCSAIVVVEQPENNKLKSVEIKGGIFSSFKPVSAYRISNNEYNIFDNPNKLIKISGGTYANEPEKNYIMSGMKAKKTKRSQEENSAGIWTVEKENEDGVVEGNLEVAGVRYDSLSEALKAAEVSEDKTVTFQGDYIDTDAFWGSIPYDFTGKIIDLNGHIFDDLSKKLSLSQITNCEIRNGTILTYEFDFINCENVKIVDVALPGCNAMIGDSKNIVWNKVKLSDVNRNKVSQGVLVCAQSKETSLTLENSEISVKGVPAIELKGEQKNNLEINGGEYEAENASIVSTNRKNNNSENKEGYNCIKITGGNFKADQVGLFSVTNIQSYMLENLGGFIPCLVYYNNIEIGGGTYDFPIDYQLIGDNFWNKGYRPIEIQDKNGNVKYGVDNKVYINFMGGSLRKDAVFDDGTCNYYKTGLRFGYEVITNQTEILSWGWKYKSDKNPATQWLEGKNKIDIKNGFITNFVVSGVEWENYSRNVESLLCVIYRDGDNICTVKDVIPDNNSIYQSRSVYVIADAILSDTDATDEDKIFAEGIKNTIPR